MCDSINMSQFPINLFKILLYYLCIIIWVNSFDFVKCFNLENRLPLIKHGEPNSYFGYSVAEHITESKETSDSKIWLLVGAPKGNNLQPNTSKSGALYKCPITNVDNDCEQVITDGIEAIDNLNLQPPGNDEIKNDQWLGVTVRSQGKGGMVFVCAHRYIRRAGSEIDGSQYGQGLCYILANDLTYGDTSEPCKGRSVAKNHEDYGFCQVGTSGTLLHDGTMVLGAPGPINWRGTLFVISVEGNFLKRDKSQYYGPHSETTSPVDKYSYLGMSVTGGKYYGPNMSYVAGAPRAKGHGQVITFLKTPNINPMIVKQTLNGEQFASNFGYEMITADINGDSLDDLIVAAPFYFSRNEGGAVYVYQNENNSLPENSTLKLTGKIESRFGLALAKLGDLNKDYCDDIAIGAPYEGNGVVYVYLGSNKGLNKQPSQIITTSDLGVTPPKMVTFGSSLSGGYDLDDNDYPDLLIGAYASDTIVTLFARPIISIRTEIQSKELININPEIQNCSDLSGTSLTCFSFKACCQINPYESNSMNSDLHLLYTVEAETFNNLKKYSRVFFDLYLKNRSNIIQKHIEIKAGGQQYCQNEMVYLKENTRDIQTAIKFRVNYTIIEPQLPASALQGLHPILDKNQAERIFSATFQKDCGRDDICESQVNVQANLALEQEANEYLLKLGLNNEVKLIITVSNTAESAYEAQLFVQHVGTLSYIGTSKGGIICTRFNKTLVSCSLGNPMPRNTTNTVTLRFDPSGLEGTESPFIFSVFANSTSQQIVRQANSILIVRVIKEAELSLNGRASPEQIFYYGEVQDEKKVKFFEDVGTIIQHTYQIYNDGPWRAPEVVVNISWPIKFVDESTRHEKWLLYLIERPFIEGLADSECTIVDRDVNPLGLKKKPIVELDIKKSDKYSASNKSYTYTHESSESSIAVYSKYSSKSSTLNRLRREIKFDFLQPENITDRKKQYIVHLDCDKENVICLKFQCKIFDLQRKSEAYIKIRGLLWNSTLTSYFPKSDSVKIFSKMHIYIPMLYGIKMNASDGFKSVETHAYPELSDSVANKGIAWWIILISIVGGLLVLALLCYCLYRFGFFKRRRPDPTLSANIEKSREDKPFLR